MALINFNFTSHYLNGNTSVSIVMPDLPWGAEPRPFYESGKKFKVLWLLHGSYGDNTDWVRRSNIELYACEKEIMVVMPNGLNANYANWPTFGVGYNMYDFMFEELMPVIYNWFPASDKREDNFIAGLSMGGRGTCVYAFNHPEKFAAAGIFSATPRSFDNMMKKDPNMWARMSKDVANYKDLDEFLAGPENSYRLLREKAGTGELPRLYFASGTEDKMLQEQWKELVELVDELKLECKMEYIEGFKHEWRFWDLAIQHALEFFGLPDINR